MKKRLGEILVDSGIVSTATIDEAIREKKPNQKLGDYLVEKGHVKEFILYSKLSEQLKIPLIQLESIDLKGNILDKLPMELLIKHTAFPIEMSGSLLTVAMADPLDESALKEIEEHSPYDVSPVLGVKSEIIDYIDKYYNIDSSMQDLFGIREESTEAFSEVQIADLFVSYIKRHQNISLVAHQLRNSIKLHTSTIPELTPNDTKNLVAFVKKIVGYNESQTEFKALFKGDSGKPILVNLTVVQKNPQLEYWINAAMVENTTQTLKNPKLPGLLHKSGIYVVYDPQFKYSEVFQSELVSLQHNQAERILIHTNDLYYESLGLQSVHSRVDDLPKFVNFAEIFVLDYGWELENIEPLLRLLKDRKKVVLHVPFASKENFLEYAEQKGVQYILNPFIEGHIFLEEL